MAEEERKEKKDKKNKTSSTVKKDKKKSSDAHEQTSTAAKPTLLADENAVDSKLSSLFAVKPVPKKAVPPPVETTQVADDDEDMVGGSEILEERPTTTAETSSKNKKRKRRDDTDDLEDNYLRKVAKQSEQEVEELKRDNKAVLPIGQSALEDEIESAEEEETGAAEVDSDDDEHYVPPQHETQTGASPELEKANRTIFIGNVAAEAVTSKSARKALEEHLKSFFDKIPKVTEEEKKAFKLESVRFRSTPFDPKLPKKAAFARGEVMTTTVQSTNAYAVYSTQALAREACRRLNATIVLDRHIRVDSVAHPAPVAHKRCVFVGNLGFVNDETNINAAKEEAGKKLKERKPADIEEGLWRLFGKHGTVESVRVVRDSKTRVGIGIAYVQFTDDIAVEGALTEDGKASPPMLPRKLRVTRARAMKRSRPTDKSRAPEKAEGYKRKVTHGESTLNGRLGKLMGKAAASKAKKDPKTAALVKRPEDFVFEGHRASSKEKNTGMKFNKKVKKAKPTGRAAKRTAAFKSGSLKRAGRG